MSYDEIQHHDQAPDPTTDTDAGATAKPDGRGTGVRGRELASAFTDEASEFNEQALNRIFGGEVNRFKELYGTWISGDREDEERGTREKERDGFLYAKAEQAEFNRIYDDWIKGGNPAIERVEDDAWRTKAEHFKAFGFSVQLPEVRPGCFRARWIDEEWPAPAEPAKDEQQQRAEPLVLEGGPAACPEISFRLPWWSESNKPEAVE